MRPREVRESRHAGHDYCDIYLDHAAKDHDEVSPNFGI